jgi:KDO2-lipid IV(A) lauroyltransferase
MMVGAVSWLPYPWASGLGRFLGTCAFWLIAGERKKALASLAQAFPEQSLQARRQLARGAFAHLGAAALELTNTRRLDAQLTRWIDFPQADLELMKRAVERGKGMVFSTGHVGSWELLARSVGQLCCEVNAVGRETSDPRMTQWVEDLRLSSNIRTVWRGQPSAARELLKVLRRGGLLAMLIDQDTRVQSVFVPFFGRPAATPRAAAELALRTGATLLSGFCQRIGNSPRYRISVQEISFTPTQDWEADVVALTALLTADIEKAIRRCPEQWVWMHQRWKTQPTAALSAEQARIVADSASA